MPADHSALSPHTPPAGSCQPGPAPADALSQLAAVLDPSDFITVLTTGQGRIPRLTVARRGLRLTEDIYACDGWYWWGWAERIAAVTDPATAARTIASRLHAMPGPADASPLRATPGPADASRLHAMPGPADA